MKDRPMTLLFILVAILTAVYLHKRTLKTRPKIGIVTGGEEKSDFGHPGVFTPVPGPTSVMSPNLSTDTP